MTSDTQIIIDKAQAKRAFDKAVQTYDEHAALQRLVVDNLIENLDVITLDAREILDIGAGTGYCARALATRYRKAKINLLDISTSMLQFARAKAPRWRSRQRYVCGDAELLPIADGTVDFVFSSLAFQWCNDLDRVFEECLRVLKPNGLLLFASLGPDTLRELRNAWEKVDNAPRVNQFIDMHDVGDALIRAGFSSPVLECDMTTLTYDDVFGVMRDLRGIGAVNSLAHRRRGLSTRRSINLMAGHYEKLRVAGRLPATYEVVYAHAWRPARKTRPQDGSTVASFPFSELKRRG